MLEYAKRSKPPCPTSPLPKSRTRRVSIQVIDVPPTTTTQDDLLTPVSSRPLNQPLSTTFVSGTPENKQLGQKYPRETKQAGSTKYGGGIFRPSGSHTIFKSEPSSAPHTKAQTDQPPRSVVNLAAFSRSWNTLTTDKHKWTLLQQIPPASLSRFFGSSFEADVLSSILSVLLAALSSGEPEQSLVKEYMVSLPQVSRFFLIYTFLRRGDKDRAKEIWAFLDGAGITNEEDEDTKKLWDI